MAAMYELPHPLWYFVLRSMQDDISAEFAQSVGDTSKIYVTGNSLPDFVADWKVLRSGRESLTEVRELSLLLPQSRRWLARAKRGSCVLSAACWEDLAGFMADHLQWSSGGMALYSTVELGCILYIEEPSIWTVEQSRLFFQERSIQVFWSWGVSPDVFWLEGLSPGDIRSRGSLPEGRYLVRSLQDVQRVPLQNWQPVQQRIQIDGGEHTTPDPMETPFLQLTIELADSHRERPVVCLKGTDPAVLTDAAQRFPWVDMEEIRCWVLDDGTYYVFQPGPSACWSYLAERLQAYCEWVPGVLLPKNTRLVPIMEPETLLEFLQGRGIEPNAVVLMDRADASVRLTVLQPEHRQSLSSHIELLHTAIVRSSKQEDALHTSVQAFLRDNPPVVSAAGDDGLAGAGAQTLRAHSAAGKEQQNDPKTTSGAQQSAPAESIAAVAAAAEPAGSPASRNRRVSSDAVNPDWPDAFRQLGGLEAEELNARQTQLLQNPEKLQQNPDLLAEYSAVLYYRNNRIHSVAVWAQRMISLSFPLQWQEFWQHPYWQEAELKGNFTQQLKDIESRDLPAEPHYCAVALNCLANNEKDQFAVLQKEMYQDFFLGDRHPYSELDARTDDSAGIVAQWNAKMAGVWQGFAAFLPTDMRGLAHFQLFCILQTLGFDPQGLEDVAQLKTSLPDMPVAESLLEWSDKSAFPSLRGRLRVWQDAVLKTIGFDPETQDETDLLFTMPSPQSTDRIMERYKNLINQGLSDRSELFPCDTSETHSLVNQLMLLDLTRVYGAIGELHVVLNFMEEDLETGPLTVADNALRLMLQLLFSEASVQTKLRAEWVPRLIDALPLPANSQVQKGWHFVVALVTQSPAAEQGRFLQLLGEKIAVLLRESPDWSTAESSLAFWMQFITAIHAAIVYSSAGENKQNTTRELQRRSVWVQFARSCSKQPFEKYVQEWKQIQESE